MLFIYLLVRVSIYINNVKRMVGVGYNFPQLQFPTVTVCCVMISAKKENKQGKRSKSMGGGL